MAAISYGQPVVTTVGRLTEPIWHSSGGVLLVAPDTHSEITAAVENLLANPSHRARLGREAKDLYDRHFDLRNVIGSLRSQNHSFCEVANVRCEDTANADSRNC